ncbi:SH3 domain-containing protein [Bacillus cytotoxicus]|uniref:SH3 domain-containing protein n=1 Tax=Bacillus cytotoxicus TaxID=580165 RepID=A0ACC6A6I8_9BACI|nr:SH3 domain-containing protein [Bacillus cytotoxicus]
MKKYLAGLTAISVAGAASPFMDNAQAKTTDQLQPTTQIIQTSSQTNGAYIVTADALHVRTGPSTSYDITSCVYKGQKLQVIGEENGWLKINHQGKTGYVSSKFVSKNGGSANSNVSTSGKKTVTADVLRVRTSPNTSSSIIGRVYEGQVLQVIGEANGWLKINYNGKTGYVSSEFVTDGGSSSTGNNENVQAANGNYAVNVSSLRVRTGPSTSHTVLGSLHKGQVVQVTGEVQNWFKINYGGKTGYISKGYVTKGGSDVNNNGQQNNNGTVQTGGTYVVNTSSLRVRTGPATYHSVIGGVVNGQALQVTGIENGWLKINHHGKIGYVDSQYVKFVPGGTTPPSEASNPSTSAAVGDYYVNASALNVRSGAGTNYGVIGALSKGTKVTVLSEQNGWSKINYNGKNGYISSQYLAKTPVSGGSNISNPAKGDKIINEAKKHIGKPYVFGTEGPSSFDCSGFITYVFNHAGYSLSRTNAQGFYNQSQKIPNPQPGDLVFFHSTYPTKNYITHVGIYIGNNKMIDAGGTRVDIRDLNSPYYRQHFVGYGRI